MQDAGDTMVRKERHGVCRLGPEHLMGAADRVTALADEELQLATRSNGVWTVGLT